MTKLMHLRRSTRHGLRRSTRIKPKRVRRKKVTKAPRDLYDRDLGGYKFVCAHKNNKWHATKRSSKQLREEENLCKKLRKGNISKDGYVIDRFFVDEDTGETTGVEETDDLFAKADTIANYSSDEEEEEWEEC